jgi:hypothetical protein
MIPEVKTCSVTDCFYNKNEQCNAHGITVGSDEPVCETFIAGSQQHTNKRGDGEVGACHVSKCEYNNGLFCHACSDITVGKQGDKAFCMTFEPR